MQMFFGIFVRYWSYLEITACNFKILENYSGVIVTFRKKLRKNRGGRYKQQNERA